MSKFEVFKSYLKEISKLTRQGGEREESYYSYVKDLVEDFSQGKLQVTILPARTEGGNPDMRVWDGRQHITGYIEGKIPSTDLDRVENSEQITRYRETFPNFILTNFYEFRLYRNNIEVKRAMIGRPFIASQLKTQVPLEQPDEFESLLQYFAGFSLPRQFTAESLAVELAKRTKVLKEVVIQELVKEQDASKQELHEFFEAFKRYLLPDLNENTFADLYAQTITYGLFAARSRSEGEFNRGLAYRFIPQTIGILRDLFKFISLGNLPPHMEVIIDDIADILGIADINTILTRYEREGRGGDPIVHFYETFLKQYDPEIRERLGVYYTPLPVVRYIVRSIHEILKSRFGRADGLASKDVTILDPAAGTLTFPAEAIKLAVAEFTGKYGEGGKKQFIKSQILKNYYAFELMMAPYAIGHMKISFLMNELGCQLEEHERFKLYLTNTLEMEEIQNVALPGLSTLSEESHEAGKVKKDEPILVILGNPPYSGISTNINAWTEQLLKQDVDGAQSYFTVDGQPLGEKKVWLQDDYVKFLRFAQWKIQKAGRGVVGMITNHGYLDNPTFRGMRQSLLKTFNEIHILNLHGNSLKKETTPEGGKDENVFDIRQGVAIALFIKTAGEKKPTVRYGDFYGMREEKYLKLGENNFESTKSKKINPATPWYFFIPRNIEEIRHYQEWPGINEIFPVNVTGIVTARDNFVIDFEKPDLERKIIQFRDLSLPDDFIRQAYHLKDTRGWKLETARKDLSKDQNWDKYWQKILYRPFDERFIYYTPKMVDWGRPEIMRNMIERDNIGLCLSKRVEGNKPWNHVFISKNLVTHHSASIKEVNLLFPLFLLKNSLKQPSIFIDEKQKDENISINIRSSINKSLGDSIYSKDILYYVYAILQSYIYQTKFIEFLQIDFPRIPFTSNRELFLRIAFLGQRLADLHLLESKELESPGVKCQGKGENDTIDKVSFDAERQRVYVNASKYFEDVTAEMWAYQIGGYQVLGKWLKDRKGRRLDDPRTYCRIATAIAKTIEIQEQIDAIYPEVEKNLINFKE